MNWKKRTKQEVDASVAKKDYTGGYEFWPWLIHMRAAYLLGFFGNILGGTIAFACANGDAIGYGAGVFFGIFAPILIGYMLRRDFKKLKIGQSS